MLADPFTSYRIVPSGASVAVPFVRISLTGSSASYTRQTYTANSGAVKNLKISHNTVGKGAGQRDRHLVRLESPMLTDGVEDGRMAACYLVMDIPKGFTSDQSGEMYRNCVGLLAMSSFDVAYGYSQANLWDKVMRGES